MSKMIRIICHDCKRQYRVRNESTIRCRRCANKLGAGVNRPNKAIHGQWKLKKIVKVSEPKKQNKQRRHVPS